MKRDTSRAEEPTRMERMEELDPVLKQAIDDFRTAVHAWSDEAYNRPRAAHREVTHRTRRLTVGWTLASLLLAGTLAGGVYEHRRETAEQAAAARDALLQRQLAARQAQQEQAQQDQDEEILASVDTAVSREVPRAMEPLAALSEVSNAQ